MGILTEDTQAPDAGAQAQEADKGGDPKYVTSDDLRSFGDSMFANMRKLVEGVTKPKNVKAREAEPVERTSQAPVDAQAIARRELEISEALAEHGQLTREQRQLIRKLVDVDKPEDVYGFVLSSAKAFGRPSSESETQPAKLAPAAARPISDGGAPSTPPRYTDDTPLVRLSADERDRLIRDKGVFWYRETLRKQAKGLRVRIR